MNSHVATIFDEEKYLYISMPYKEVYEELDDEYGKSEYGSKKIPSLVMHWIGYIYRFISIRCGIPSKKIYKLFPVNFLLEVYNGFHTMNPAIVIEKMAEIKNIDLDSFPDKVYFYDNYIEPSDKQKRIIEDNLKKGLEILKRLKLEDK